MGQTPDVTRQTRIVMRQAPDVTTTDLYRDSGALLASLDFREGRLVQGASRPSLGPDRQYSSPPALQTNCICMLPLGFHGRLQQAFEVSGVVGSFLSRAVSCS